MFLLNLKWTHQSMDPSLFSKHILNDPVIARNNSQNVANKRKRGKRGGVHQRLKRQLHNNRIPLPSIILTNVQSGEE